jgi:hypothetical protein
MMADGSKSWSFSTPCPFLLRYRTLPSNYLINICVDLRSVEVVGQARHEVVAIAVGGGRETGRIGLVKWITLIHSQDCI